MAFAAWAPVLRISALTGRSVGKVLDLAETVARNRASRVPTARLNDVLSKVRESGHTVVSGNRRLRVNYATQVGVRPPAFTFFCNSPDLVNDNYRRFLENRLRDAFELEGTPIRMRFRKKDGGPRE
jgi:GTP-binding protein